MSFRNPISLATIVGSVIETNVDGQPRIVMGPSLGLGGPGLLWEMNGTGPDPNQPGIIVKTADNHLEISGEWTGVPGSEVGAMVGLWRKDGTGPAQASLEATGLATGLFFVDGDTGDGYIGQQVNVSGQPWTAATLGNGWINIGGFAAAGYRKMVDGTIKLRGLISTGVGPIFTLPPGYRPPAAERFAAQSATAVARVDVAANGLVQVGSYDTGAANTSVSLSGIRFSCRD